MKIVVDENIPRRTVEELRQQGYVVLDLRDTPDRGADDRRVWDIARQESALLVTTDKGFIHRHRESHSGVLVVRLRQPNRQRIHERIIAALSTFPENSWPGQTVVMRDRARSVRRAPASPEALPPDRAT